jgi:hypothetical protein
MTAALMWKLAVRSLLLSQILVRPASAEENDVVLKNVESTLVAPFSATVKPSFLHVYLRPEADSPEVGLLRKGAQVLVTSCHPDCESPRAWAVLGNDGAARLDSLAPEPILADRPIHLTAESLWYGRVGKSGITIFREPRLGGPILTRKRLSREMAFLPNAGLRRNGWMERIEGGFVRARRVQVLVPSLFHGELWPHLPIAFVVRDLHQPGKARTIVAHRYDRFPIQELDGTSVATSRGSLPRSGLRIVTHHSPPQSIPAGAKWVLVDLSQQTLTAYEGETAVYATLISGGKDHKESQTHAGLYQVEHKMAYSDMHGEPDDPYDVDRVPYTLYFNKDEALHGAYWHNRFGSPASHGCINLALADARWLFDWAPPQLPESWHTIDPRAAGLSSLWVFIKQRATLNQLPQFSAAGARPTLGM